MIFKIMTLSFLIFIVMNCAYGQGPECRPGYCDEVPCASRRTCSKPNQYIKETTCGCCPVCFTLLDEGESCPPILLGGPPATSACMDGLQCIGGVCQSVN